MNANATGTSRRVFCTAIASAALTLGLTSLTGCSTTDDSGSIAVDGSTSMEKVVGALGESFSEAHSNISFSYSPTGSGSGIQAVSEGRCDIGLSSRYLTDDEKDSALVETVLAYDGIAVIVNPDNSVNALTEEQIADIYTGAITNWKDLGGDDAQIVVIGREAGSGTRDGFEGTLDIEDACDYRQELTSTGDVIATVGQNPAAIGYASLASVSSTVQLVAVEGVIPTEDTVRDGSYPIQRPFVFVTKEGKDLSEPAQEFYDYALSADTVEIITGVGVVPATQG